MNKITIKDEDKTKIYKYIKNKFTNNLKKDAQNEKWEISLKDFEKLISNYLSKYDKNISFERLVNYKLSDMEKLVSDLKKDGEDFSDKNDADKVEFSKYFHELYSRLDNFMITDALNVKVCLYCNRNYIINFKNENGKQVTAQLDHFFCKSKFPFFAVSIYNLIPCCSTCNIRKSDGETTIFNPFFDCFHNHAKFSYKGILDEHIEYEFFHEKRINLDLDYKNNIEKAKKYNEVFNIKSIYNEHRNIVSDLLKKEIIYSEEYIDKIYDTYKELFLNREDVLNLILNVDVNVEDMNSSPMNKLICDIAEQLNILKNRD